MTVRGHRAVGRRPRGSGRARRDAGRPPTGSRRPPSCCAARGRIVATGNGAAYYVAHALWLASLEARAAGPPIVAVPGGLVVRERLPLAAGRRGARGVLVGRVPRRGRDRAARRRAPVRGDHRERGVVARRRRRPPRSCSSVATQRAVTHTQALAGAYASGLALWAAVTGDDGWLGAGGRARRGRAGDRRGARRGPPAGSVRADRRDRRRRRAGVGGRARARADAQGDLAHPRRGRRDARGRDVRDVRARPRAPDGLARPRGDPLGDEAMRLCAAAGATTLRLPGVARRGPAAGRRSPRCRPSPRSRPTLALAGGHDVDHPAWTDAYYETARSAT